MNVDVIKKSDEKRGMAELGKKGNGMKPSNVRDIAMSPSVGKFGEYSIA